MGSLAGGDRLERFIKEFSEKAFQFAFHQCGNIDEARELTQEAFFRAIRKWDQYDPSQRLDNWFLGILRNLHYDALKSYERRYVVPLDAPLSPDEPEGSTYAEAIADRRDEDMLVRLERRETEEEVRDALDSLRPEFKAVLALSDIQGLRYEQIAEALDWPLGTVKSRIRRAREALKQSLLRRTGEAVER